MAPFCRDWTISYCHMYLSRLAVWIRLNPLPFHNIAAAFSWYQYAVSIFCVTLEQTTPPACIHCHYDRNHMFETGHSQLHILRLQLDFQLEKYLVTCNGSLHVRVVTSRNKVTITECHLICIVEILSK